MSLSEEDRKEISKLFNECYDMRSMIDDWDKNAIKTDFGFVIAPKDFERGDEKLFSWEEAKEIEERYLKAKGWRLPTQEDWWGIIYQFGFSLKGEMDVKRLMKDLNLELMGSLWVGEAEKYKKNPRKYILDGGLGGICHKTIDGKFWRGEWWSSTTLDDSNLAVSVEAIVHTNRLETTICDKGSLLSLRFVKDLPNYGVGLEQEYGGEE